MSGVTLKDLSKYHQGLMKHLKNGLALGENKFYATTPKAGAVSFWPLGGTPIDAVVDFKFKETPPASGDKGPENPSTITGVSSVAVGRCGKNLFPKNTVLYNANGVTISYNSDGCLVMNGTYSDANVQRYYANTDGSSLFGSFVPCSMKLDPAKQYKFWAKLISGSITGSLRFLFGNKSHQISIGGSNLNNGLVCSATIPVGYCDYFTIRTNLNVGASYSNAVIQMQLEEGTDITDFEPPMSASEIKSVINLGSTYYGGSIDLKTGVMTVTHSIKVLDGTEAWGATPVRLAEGVYRYGYSESRVKIGSLGADGGAVCSHFNYIYNYSSPQVSFYIGPYNTENATFFCFKSPESTTELFTAWLHDQYEAGTPVTVAGLLKTPQTVQLTPLQLTALAQKDKYTPRINTLYTDADSIQAVYRKSLIHDEDEKVQAIVALGGSV